MKCIYFRIRSKNYTKLFYCVKERKEIDLKACNKCSSKIYKFVKPMRKSDKPMKNRSSKLSKACDIPLKVKDIVSKRDNGICVICKVRAGKPNMHYIPRSQLGLGIEQNIVCGCEICHHEYDNGKYRKEHGETIKKHLQSKYKSWNEEELIYHKYNF